MMDDNMRHPKKKHEAKDDAKQLLEVVKKTNEQYKSKEIVNVLIGKVNALIKSHRTDAQEYFGSGANRDAAYWMALLRQLLVAGYLKKDIETYGVIHLTEEGKKFIKSPTSFMMTEDHSYKDANDDIIVGAKKGGDVADENLFKLLKAELKKVALKYPVNMEELSNVHGVGEGKAKKYGKPFLKLIQNYVEEHDIIRPEDFVVKSTGSNSSLKLYIIQNVDRKLALPDIANAKGLEMPEFIKEMEAIVYSGTKLNIDYWIDEVLDEDQQEEIHEYFLEAKTDKIEEALEEFDGDYDEEELRLYRIKFISEVGN